MTNKAIKEIKDPQLFISKEARELYDNLRQQCEEFKQMDNKDFFVLALLFGQKNTKRKRLDGSAKTESGFFRLRNLTDEEKGIFQAIAIAETKDIAVINDVAEIVKIAEEYANGGVSFLKEFIFEEQASFIKNFAAELKLHAK